jgi:hypothetical protein
MENEEIKAEEGVQVETSNEVSEEVLDSSEETVEVSSEL